jgi:glycosyltransferase involved in cell wall biosynthesis
MISRQMAFEFPRVAHYRERFPVLSETFIRETVTRHQRYESIVLAHVRVTDVHVDGVGLILSPAGPPLVVSSYGYDATHLAQFPMWRRRFTRLFRNAAAVPAEGQHRAARLIALGAPVDNVILHPIPIGIERFPFRPATPPRAGEPIVFLQACRFVEKKGVDVTIAAFARIAVDVPSAVHWLMGSGPEEARLRSMADERASGIGSRSWRRSRTTSMPAPFAWPMSSSIRVVLRATAMARVVRQPRCWKRRRSVCPLSRRRMRISLPWSMRARRCSVRPTTS